MVIGENSQLTTIGEDAFWECNKITSLIIPDSVTVIKRWAFSRCARLANLKLGSGVTHIYERAFDQCDSLTSITIPDSVKEIGYSIFCGCNSLTDVRYSGTKEQWSKNKKHENWDSHSPFNVVHCADGSISLE